MHKVALPNSWNARSRFGVVNTSPVLKIRPFVKSYTATFTMQQHRFKWVTAPRQVNNFTTNPLNRILTDKPVTGSCFEEEEGEGGGCMMKAISLSGHMIIPLSTPNYQVNSSTVAFVIVGLWLCLPCHLKFCNEAKLLGWNTACSWTSGFRSKRH